LSAGLIVGGFLNHTHPVGLLWRRDRIVRKAATYNNTHIGTTNIHAFSWILTQRSQKTKRLQTHNLDLLTADIASGVAVVLLQEFLWYFFRCSCNIASSVPVVLLQVFLYYFFRFSYNIASDVPVVLFQVSL